jgi:hypothetical protein
MMTVQELIDHLSKFDPNLEVWMSEQAIRYMPVGEPTLDRYGDPDTLHTEVIHPDDLTYESWFEEEGAWYGNEDRETQYQMWLESLKERVTIWGAW